MERLKGQQESLRTTFKSKQQEFQAVVAVARQKLQANRAPHQ
jgi:aspartate ammonia-lyase